MAAEAPLDPVAALMRLEQLLEFSMQDANAFAIVFNPFCIAVDKLVFVFNCPLKIRFPCCVIKLLKLAALAGAVTVMVPLESFRRPKFAAAVIPPAVESSLIITLLEGAAAVPASAIIWMFAFVPFPALPPLTTTYKSPEEGGSR